MTPYHTLELTPCEAFVLQNCLRKTVHDVTTHMFHLSDDDLKILAVICERIPKSDQSQFSLNITLPHPSKALRPNIAVRMHWAAKADARAKARAAARNATADAVAAQNIDLASFRPSAYTLRWFFKGQKPDADNCLASCKGYLDGICDVLGINDRDLEVSGIYRIHDKAQANTITLTFQ